MLTLDANETLSCARRARRIGRWLAPLTGKLRTVWALVMVLACSRHMFVRPVLKMDQRA